MAPSEPMMRRNIVTASRSGGGAKATTLRSASADSSTARRHAEVAKKYGSVAKTLRKGGGGTHVVPVVRADRKGLAKLHRSWPSVRAAARLVPLHRLIRCVPNALSPRFHRIHLEWRVGRPPSGSAATRPVFRSVRTVPKDFATNQCK